MTTICDLEAVKAHLQFAEFLLEHSDLAELVQFDDDGDPLIPRTVAGEFRRWLAERESSAGLVTG